VLDAMRADPDAPKRDLIAIARGAQAAAKARTRADGSLTLGEARDLILNDPEGWKAVRSRGDYERNINLSLPHLGGEKAPTRGVTKDALGQLRDALLAGGNAEATVNRKVFAVMKMLRFAHAQGQAPHRAAEDQAIRRERERTPVRPGLRGGGGADRSRPQPR